MASRRTSVGVTSLLGILCSLAACTNAIESLEGSIELVSTNPSVPSNDPEGKLLVRGTAWDNVESLDFFNHSSCDSQPLSTLSREDFEEGATLIWPTDTQFEVFVRPRFSGGSSGICKKLFDYSNDTTAPDNPSFTGFSVNGGSIAAVSSLINPSVTSLRVAGTGVAANDDVSLFSDNSCLVEIGSGSGQDFMSSGIEVSSTHVTAVRNAGLSGFYARAQDAAGNTSSCVLLSNLNYDTIAPSLSFSNPTSTVAVTGCSATRNVTGSCSENGQTVSVSLLLSGTSVTSASGTCSAGSFSVSLSFSGSDLQTFIPRAVLTDQAGNSTTLNTSHGFKLTSCGGGGVVVTPGGDQPAVQLGDEGIAN